MPDQKPAVPPAGFGDDVVDPLVLHTGDRVLIGLSTARSAADLREMADQLRDRFPGVEFTFMGGVTDVAVQRGEAVRG